MNLLEFLPTREFCRPLKRGLGYFLSGIPGLTPGAKLCRRFAAQ